MNINIYTIIDTILLIFIFWFFVTFKKRRAKQNIKKKILADSDSNYSDIAKNIALSISKARILYKELIVKVHPDRFFYHKNNKRDKRANELASHITESKRNYEKLLKLEVEVEEFLKKSD